MLQYRYHGREKRVPGRVGFLANNLSGYDWNDPFPAGLRLGCDWLWSGKYLPVCGIINRSADSSGFVIFLDNSRYSGRLCGFVSEDDSWVTPNHQQDSGISR